MVASTLFAASAAGNIELRMSNYAMPHSKLENAQEESLLTEQVERALKEPKPLQSITSVKRKADNTHDIPRFCRGYLCLIHLLHYPPALHVRPACRTRQS